MIVRRELQDQAAVFGVDDRTVVGAVREKSIGVVQHGRLQTQRRFGIVVRVNGHGERRMAAAGGCVSGIGTMHGDIGVFVNVPLDARVLFGNRCANTDTISDHDKHQQKNRHLPAVIFAFRFFLPIAVQRKEDRADPDQHDNRKQPQRVDPVAPHGGPQDFFICQCTDHGWPPPAARVHTARSEYTMVRLASMSGSRFLRAKCTNRRHTEVCRRFFCPACAPVLSRTPAGRRKKLRTRRCAVCRYANRLSTSGAVAAAWARTRRQRHRRG